MKNKLLRLMEAHGDQKKRKIKFSHIDAFVLVDKKRASTLPTAF